MTSEDVLAKLQKLVGGLLGASEPLESGADLFEEGLDSLAFMQLIVLLEKEFAFKFAAEDLQRERFASLGSLSQLVQEKLA